MLSCNLSSLFVAALLLLQGSVCCNIRALFILLMQISHQYYKLGLAHSGFCVTLLFVLMHFIRCCLELKDWSTYCIVSSVYLLRLSVCLLQTLCEGRRQGWCQTLMSPSYGISTPFSFKGSVPTITVPNDKFPSLDRKSVAASYINEPGNCLI